MTVTRVHHLDCGNMHPLGGWLMDGRFGLRLHAHLVCHCLLIETDETLILVDTGFGTRAHDRGNEWVGKGFIAAGNPDLSLARTAAHQVRELGYDPADVRHVIVTHLDADHAGGLADFPEATVHVYATELAAMRRPETAAEMLRYRRVQIRHGPRWRAYAETGTEFYGFGAVRDLDGLPPEILLIPLPGHSRGHAGVAIDLGGHWLLHAGDAYDAGGEVHPGRPGAGPAMAFFHEYFTVHDRGARAANRLRLRELARDHGAEVTVFSAHCAVDFARAAALAAAR
ncbi:MBL fold metallo-hydrolase [Nocardia mexicana]|uniref:Metallo-beta-lactamase superfamily protein n=1 Tax=Nocardia mexicana TaxID=279262 RepID=A0A370GNM7_9NOCA|nr:MBL fold metallo-hydrolase [Nocardia mexicana]RDI44939.1 metallo-beta-lactamase superfamily protein [Nocardia mexicana]